MAVIRVYASRWLHRYRLFFVIGFMILGVQIYLAYKSLAINTNSTNNYSDLSSSEYKKTAGSILAKKYKSNINDDEDVQNSPNSVHNSKSKTDSKNYINQRLNKTTLRLNELDFTPACDIVTKEAISAIHRAKTQACKQYISNITCLIQENKFYSEQLPNSCPSDDFKANTPLGCYKDEKNFRLLSGYYANFKTTNSPNNCMRMCLQSGFPYAGVQYTTECFCGSTPPPSAAKLPDSSCNMKCSGDVREACGGYFTINIYETGIAKFSPQVAETTADQFEKPARIVYLLTLNGRATRQVYRLIKALFHTNHYFYIHVDSRQDYLFRELLSLETKFENIKLARTRFSTIWGGASLLKMLLASMKELTETSWSWDFVINLSESDFPVKTNEKLVEFLTANKGRNFVKSHGREVQRFIQKQGLDKTFVECDTHMWRIGDRVLPWGIQIDGGSDWISLSRDFVTYITDPDDLVKGLLIIFYHTLLPAESFFHTVLRNSRFCNTYVDNNLHVTNWKRRLGCKCQYKHIVDWCGCSPNDFKTDDWPRLQLTESKQLFFARKFEPVINQEIILKVEEWLYGPYSYDVPNLHSYWQSVYHLADLSPPPDDALMTIANSLIRIHSKTLLSEKCGINVKNLIEVTTYFLNDKFKGLLLLHNGYVNDIDDVKMETWVKPQHFIQLQKTSKLVKRLKTIIVSSEYDQKEQFSRNFGRALGPYSEPVLVYEFLPGSESTSSAFNVTVLWIDPAGNLADVSDVHIEDGHVFNFVKPNIKEPHLPGIWNVRIIHNKVVVIQNKFLITPLIYFSGTEISQSQTDFIHSGSISSYKNSFTATEWEVFLPSVSERAILENKSAANSKRTGLDLQEWIDSLTSRFYSSLGTCLVSKNRKIAMEILKCGKIKLDSCKSTIWSSFAPDPKSFVSSVNEDTHRLNRH